jgi:hypothetical protein
MTKGGGEAEIQQYQEALDKKTKEAEVAHAEYK